MGSYKLIFANEMFRLTPAVEPTTTEGLELLLSSVGATLSRSDDLKPCFDIDELKQRNQRRK